MTDETKEHAIMIVKPDVQGAVDAMAAFQDIKSKILVADDKVDVQGKTYIKRSGFRKIALAFGISTEILSVEREMRNNGVYIVFVRARASSSNGRYADGSAVCDSTEFSGNMKPTMHNIETKSTTRAINRAIAELVGGGAISAEEMDVEETPGEQPHQAHEAITPAQCRRLNKELQSGNAEIEMLIKERLRRLSLEAVEKLDKWQASEIISAVEDTKVKN